MQTKDKIMVIGASGQIGTELVVSLREIYGSENVLASDIKGASDEVLNGGPFELLDVLDKESLFELIKKYKINQVYLLAALLSATAEEKVRSAWKLNMDSLLNVLDLAKEGRISKIFWPSSIAVFGNNTPKENTPQFTIIEPDTVYGISKLAGERWCEYYHYKYGTDVRSLRYPGIVGYKSIPKGGTTDYAVHIFHEAIAKNKYECFLSKDTMLPMIYMHDAIRATLELMETEQKNVKIRSSYNLSGMSFTPTLLADEIRKHIPDFKISYAIDHRQQIADSWPQSIDDSHSRKDWGWKPEYDMKYMVEDMLLHLVGEINDIGK